MVNMKLVKYFAGAMLLLGLVSCQKHEIKYDTKPAGDAEFQFHYFEPVPRSQTAYYIDSLFVDNILYSSVNGAGQLASYNGVPGGATGRFFSTNSGQHRFVLYRGGEVIYDKTVNLMKGKQNVVVYDLDEDPKVFDNLYPYQSHRDPSTISPKAEWGTDSVAYVRFFNFMYTEIDDEVVPYPGTLQYQWRNDVKDEFGEWVWHNVGNPVRFGEASDIATLIVHKTVFNSKGYQSIYYRILDENGEVLKTTTSAGKFINYSDYWTAYIGRAYSHFWAGIQTKKSPQHAYVSQWTNL